MLFFNIIDLEKIYRIHWISQEGKQEDAILVTFFLCEQTSFISWIYVVKHNSVLQTVVKKKL